MWGLVVQTNLHSFRELKTIMTKQLYFTILIECVINILYLKIFVLLSDSYISKSLYYIKITQYFGLLKWWN